MQRSPTARPRRDQPGWLVLVLLAAAPLCHACAASHPRSAARHYQVAFQATLLPAEAAALASITVSQDRHELRELTFTIDPAIHTEFSGDGDWQVTGRQLRWRLQPAGGSITYRVAIPHERSPGRYDAWIEQRWGLFRGDDLFPPARAKTLIGATATATVTIDAPAGWSVVTPYGSGAGQALAVDNPERRFDRPTGWMVAGELGIRRDLIGATQVAVAGPVGQGVRRQDILALLNWTLPTLDSLFGPLPQRLLIVSAGDPMWRGGLSGPDSLFLHADRPLISENGTSSLVHELVHVALSARSAARDDWLVEGVAEYYALEVLHRSGTISRRRYEQAHQHLQRWGADVAHINGNSSRGMVTARAVTLLAALDSELAGRGSSLTTVVRQLRDDGGVFSREALVRAAENAAGGELPDFSRQLAALTSPPP